jgi:hypothetical protein
VSALDPLASATRWVAWRNEPRGDKLTKVPYAPSGRTARADDPATWATRVAAETRAQQLINGHGGGIGIELGDLGADTYLGGMDLDSCLNGEACATWAQAICDLAQTYAEISPSGKGLKLFFYLAAEDARPFLDKIGVPPHQWGCRRNVTGEDARDHGPAIEVYLSGRYFTVTDRLWPGCPYNIASLDTHKLSRLASLVPPPRQSAGASSVGDNSRSAIAFRKGIALRRAGKSYEEMVEALRADPETAAWVREKGDVAGGRELRKIWEKAVSSINEAAPGGISLVDFYAYMPTHTYIFVPSREMWPSGSVNARIPPIPILDSDGNPALGKENRPLKLSASSWLDQNKPVEQMTWAPGFPMIIVNRLISQGGWIKRDSVSCFNLYRRPTIEPGDARQAGPWIDHVHQVFPGDAEHIIQWLAHRVQRPQDKINHALVLGGGMGIGKDTMLEPVKHAVGPWNFSEISPQQAIGRFNGFLRSVILRISEGRDLGDLNRYQFYDHLKVFIAAPPDVLRIDEKNLREYSIPNVCGVIITTNYKTDGIYLSADDRRHFVAWSDRKKEDFTDSYWRELYGWYDNGGNENVAAHLADLDLSTFNAKAPPPQTLAFWEIVDASRAPEDAELADVIDKIDRPKTITLIQLAAHATERFADWLLDRKNSRSVPHRLETSGYVAVRNERAKDGLWKLDGKRQVIYADAGLPLRDRIEAARDRAGS